MSDLVADVKDRFEDIRLTPALRWVPLSMMQAHERKLQQAWEIRVVDASGFVYSSRTEWQDVPYASDTP